MYTVDQTPSLSKAPLEVYMQFGISFIFMVQLLVTQSTLYCSSCSRFNFTPYKSLNNMRAVQFVADLHVYRSQVVAKTSLKLAIEHVH